MTRRRFLPNIAMALVVILSSSVVVSRPGSAPSSEDASQRVIDMTLVHPNFETKVRVPLEYLGPRFLELAIKNRSGGEQSRFLIEFYYPSMRPNTPENARLKETELLTYASITNTVPGAARRSIVRETSDNNGVFESTGEEVCGLQLSRSVSEHYKRRLYFYKEPGKVSDSRIETVLDNVFASDVYMLCDSSNASRGGASRCRWTFDTELDLAIDLNGIPESRVCEWPELTRRLRALVNGFVAKEE